MPNAASQQRLAERSGVSVETISKLERGERQWPRPTTIQALSQALDADPSDLTGKRNRVQQVDDTASSRSGTPP